MQQKNHQVVLVRPLSGVPLAEDFRIQEAGIPEPGPGELLVRHIYLSLDPYQRSAIAGRHMASRQPLGAGAMPMAETVGQVLRSRHPGFREGDYVRHFGGWRQRCPKAPTSITTMSVARCWPMPSRC